MNAVANITKIRVTNYAENYGGVSVMIEGKECSISSVVGYALYNNDDPVEAVLRTQEKMRTRPYDGHKMVWINRHAAVMTSQKGYYEARDARRALMPKLELGDRIEFEGKTYEISSAPNDNFKLVDLSA